MTIIANRYIIINTLIALIMISVVLAVIVFLTQSLRFLELIIEAGAGGSTFFVITILALPRFFEVIFPIALAAAVIFVYQRMTTDREITILRASGFSPIRLAQPVLIIAGGVSIILWLMTLWLAPISLRTMQQMQHVLKSEFSTLAFQQGVFNQFGSDITVFIREKDSSGNLEGLMIYDRRKENKNPVTVTAVRGQIQATEKGLQVIVFDGSRQDYNPETQTLNRLDFERYNIDIPLSGTVGTRWREPNERTFLELLNPDPNVPRDMENLKEFRIEAHRRVISPLMAPALTLMVLPFLLLGPHQRRGISRRIIAAVCSIIILQALYLGAFNFSRQMEIIGLIAMYATVFVPIIGGCLVMSSYAESWRQKNFYKDQEKTA